MKSAKHKHLTLDDKELIEDSLKNNFKLKEIAYVLKKDPTTISKEIRRRRIATRLNTYGKSKEYLESLDLVCPLTEKFPHVCNACKRRSYCPLQKYYYRARDAHSAYLYDLKDSRVGYNTTVEVLKGVADVISPLIKQGHSFYHIVANNPDIPYSIQTLYNYTNDGLFSIKNIDLPKKVKYKVRKRSHSARIRESKKGLEYKDYEDFIESNDIVHTVQMDTVHGLINDSKVMLTLQFLPSRFMLIRLLPSNTAQEIVKVFDQFEKELGMTAFKNIFNVVLTDNGSEFDDIIGLKFSSITGEHRMNLFYCDAMRSNQKGALEKNHTLIRKVFPKGTSTNILDEAKVKLMETHINSYTRSVLNNKTPYDVFYYTYGVSFIEAFQISKVKPNDVVLKPHLIK